MKAELSLTILLFVGFTSFAQKLPDDLDKNPDGIQVSYWCSSEKKCQRLVYISDSTNAFFYKCYNVPHPSRVVISKNDSIIRKIRDIVTFDFVKKLQKCCEDKGCWDSACGWFIMRKENENLPFITIDKAFVGKDKCGNKEFTELMRLFKKIEIHYP